MCVDAHISRRAREGFPLTIRDVLFRLRISVLFGHTKIYHMNDIRRLRTWSTNQKVVGFDIAINEILFMDSLNSRELGILAENERSTPRANHLFCNHYDCLGGKPSVAVIKKIFKGRAEEVDDENVVQAFLAKIIYIRDTSYSVLAQCSLSSGICVLTASNKNFIRAILISQLWGVALSRFQKGENQSALDHSDRRETGVERTRLQLLGPRGLTYEFDGHLLVVQQVCFLEDNTK